MGKRWSIWLNGKVFITRSSPSVPSRGGVRGGSGEARKTVLGLNLGTTDGYNSKETTRTVLGTGLGSNTGTPDSYGSKEPEMRVRKLVVGSFTTNRNCLGRLHGNLKEWCEGQIGNKATHPHTLTDVHSDPLISRLDERS